MYNDPDVKNASNYSSILTVGCGYRDDINKIDMRRNALVVYRDGTIELPMVSNNNIGSSVNSVATKGYVDNMLIQTGTKSPDQCTNLTAKYYI